MFCMKCGTELVEGDVFCRTCGTAVPRESAAGETPATPAQGAQAQGTPQEPAAPVEGIASPDEGGTPGEPAAQGGGLSPLAEPATHGGAPAAQAGEPAPPQEGAAENPLVPPAQAPAAAPIPPYGQPVGQPAQPYGTGYGAPAPTQPPYGTAPGAATPPPTQFGGAPAPTWQQAAPAGQQPGTPVPPPPIAGQAYTAPPAGAPVPGAQAGQPYGVNTAPGYTQPPYATTGQPAQPYGQPQYGEAAPAYTPGQPDEKSDKNRFKLPIIIVAVLLAVAIVAALVVPRLLRGMDPTARVFNAFSNTFATMEKEWEATFKTLGLAGLGDAYEDGRVHSRLGFEMSGLDDDIDRAGINLEAWTDYEARRMEGTGGIAMSGISFAEFGYGLADNIAWAEMPLLFEGVYGVNTETMGRDMDRLNGYSVYGDDLGFNLYDIYAEVRQAAVAGDTISTLEPATEDKIASLNANLTAGIETLRISGTSVAMVNGNEQAADWYTMSISGDAMKTWVRGMGSALLADGIFMQNWEAFYAGYSTTNPYNYYSNAGAMLDDTIDELVYLLSGGVEADIYIKDNCVVRADIRVLGSYANDSQLTLEFGGADNLIDALSVTVAHEYSDWTDIYSLVWAGQHVPVDGVFSTSLTLVNEWRGYADVAVDFSLEWDSKGDYNNLNFTLGMPGAYSEPEITGRGSLAVDGDAGRFDLSLNSITYQDYWDDVYTFAFDYFVEPYDSHEFGSNSPTLLLDMSEAELEALYQEISFNALMLMFDLAF